MAGVSIPRELFGAFQKVDTFHVKPSPNDGTVINLSVMSVAELIAINPEESKIWMPDWAWSKTITTPPVDTKSFRVLDQAVPIVSAVI